MSRTVDFDAFRAEQKAESVTILIGGESYEMPAEMPAEVALEVIALKQEFGDTAEVPGEKIGDLAKALFGADLLRTLVSKHRLSTNELAALILQVFGQYDSALAPNPTASATRRTKGRTTSP